MHDKRLTKSDKNECAKCLHEACTCSIPLLLHENLVDLNNADFEVSNSNLINNTDPQNGEILSGQDISGVKGFFAETKLKLDNNKGKTGGYGKKELFAVSSNYVESSY